MGMTRWLRLRALSVRVLACMTLVVSLAMVSPANAGHSYWDFHGWLNPASSGDVPYQYGRTHYSDYGLRWIRLNRSNCNAKVQLHYRSGGWDQVYIGCENNDVWISYPGSTYDAARAINLGTSDVWANVRLDTTGPQ